MIVRVMTPAPPGVTVTPAAQFVTVSVGVQGPPGPTGQQGETGPQGPAGPEGSQGPAGATGAQGAQGEPGRDGLPGADGVQATGFTRMVALKQAAYDALNPPDPTTLYLILGDSP